MVFNGPQDSHFFANVPCRVCRKAHFERAAAQKAALAAGCCALFGKPLKNISEATCPDASSRARHGPSRRFSAGPRPRQALKTPFPGMSWPLHGMFRGETSHEKVTHRGKNAFQTDFFVRAFRATSLLSATSDFRAYAAKALPARKYRTLRVKKHPPGGRRPTRGMGKAHREAARSRPGSNGFFLPPAPGLSPSFAARTADAARK